MTMTTEAMLEVLFSPVSRSTINIYYQSTAARCWFASGPPGWHTVSKSSRHADRMESVWHLSTEIHVVYTYATSPGIT